MLELSSSRRRMKNTHTAHPATKNGRRNMLESRIINPRLKVEDHTLHTLLQRMGGEIC